MASSRDIPRLPRHAFNFALSPTEDDERLPLVAAAVLPLVVVESSGASPLMACLCRAYNSSLSRFDGGFRGRHDFIKFVLARKVDAGVAMVLFLNNQYLFLTAVLNFKLFVAV